VAVGTIPVPAAPAEKQGLKANAIGFVDGLIVGLNSTAPAYSLAAVIGSKVAGGRVALGETTGLEEAP
jgi:hypothetical protein